MPKPKSIAGEIMDLLKEQRALFLLMLAYAGSILGAIWNWQTLSRKWLDVFPGVPMVWLFVFAFGPVLVPVIYVLVRRWRTASLEKRLADVGKDRLKFKHDHFRTAPYEATEEDRKAFTRADHAHKEALDRIRAAAANEESFFFLHSPSGCGKTSLLQAYAVPEMEKASWQVFTLRGFTGILPELARALGLAESATLAEIQTALSAQAKEKNPQPSHSRQRAGL